MAWMSVISSPHRERAFGIFHTVEDFLRTATFGNLSRIMSAGVVLIARSWCSPSHGRMICANWLNQ